MNFKSIIFLLTILLPQSFNAYASYTKGQIDYGVAEFRSTLIYSMKSHEQDGCTKYTYHMLSIIDDAHQLFMSDQIIPSVLKAIKLIETTEGFSRNSFCPYQIVTRARIASSYIRYYFEQQPNPESVLPTSINTQRYTDSDRASLSNIVLNTHRDLLSTCKTTGKCTDRHKKILDLIQNLHTNINKENVDMNSIILSTLFLNMSITKETIFSGYVDLHNALIDTRKRLYNVLRLTRKYVFLEDDLSLSERYQLKLLNYALEETNSSSTCHVIIFNYYEALSWLDSSDFPKAWAMVYVLNELFSALYEDNYKGTVYARNKYCSTKEADIIALPYDFSKEVKKYIGTLS
jgi:hypothetical protein